MNNKIYHIQMIQGVINRLASNSFLIKGWSITVIAAMIALLAKGTEKRYVLFALLPVVMFWILDAYYLDNERRFKVLYNETRLLEDDKIDFSMDIHRFKKGNSWLKAFLSPTLVLFNLALILTVITIYEWL